MDTPRSSSNGLLVIVCLGLLALCGYKVYQDRLERERLANMPPPPKPRPATPAPPREQTITVSRVIEPLYVDLFSDLNKDNPVDLVPQMTIARERILDKQAAAAKDKQAVYDLGTKLLDGMISAAEERTQALEALLKAASQPRAALDGGQSMTSSHQHFVAAHLRRGTESLKRRKNPLDTHFAQLRTAEREWNTRLPKNSPQEAYDMANIPPAIITVDVEARQNPLEQKAYDQRRAVYPWRRIYYDQYGYPRTRSY